MNTASYWGEGVSSDVLRVLRMGVCSDVARRVAIKGTASR